MSKYTNQVTVHNEWTLVINGVWIHYSNSSQTHYYDFPKANIAMGSDFNVAPPDSVIISESGDADHWTITILDSEGRLWGTEQSFTANIPHCNGSIEISIYAQIGSSNTYAVFRMPDGSSQQADITRI